MLTSYFLWYARTAAALHNTKVGNTAMSDHGRDPSRPSTGDEKSLKAPSTAQEASTIDKEEYFWDNFKPAHIESAVGSPMVLGQVAATNNEDTMFFAALRTLPWRIRSVVPLRRQPRIVRNQIQVRCSNQKESG
ncbi:hypothetical protein MBLNU13_g05347t3 [Cladosporium sp. NU13]